MPSLDVAAVCRLCGKGTLSTFLDFGPVPLAGGFLRPDELESERSYPLSVALCSSCTGVQVRESVPPGVLFHNYRYLASSTTTLSEHFRRYAAVMVDRFLSPGELVVEIGSNDGVLQVPFMGLGVRALGVEPAANIVEVARRRGCEAINDFFSPEVANHIRAQYGRVPLVCANNVFAHIPNISGVLRGVVELLSPTGVFVIEVGYLVDLIEKVQYDFIYHEHLFYYSLSALERLFDSCDLEVFDVERIPIHSGSIRVYAQRRGAGRPRATSVVELRELEEKQGLGFLPAMEAFAKKVDLRREQLRELVSSLTHRGKRVVGYGASGRATMHLNLSSLSKDLIPYVVDQSPERLGRLVPGTRTPIAAPERFRIEKPDYALVFAYNYLAEISQKEEDFLRGGGRFIVPLPFPAIVNTRE
jgi:hypothetical protein